MTPALETFFHRFAELGGDPLRWRQTEGSLPALAYPAAHTEVGGLSIEDNGDELTVEIGNKHHTHFSASDHDGDSHDVRITAAALAAAQFAIDVIHDRVCFTVDFRHDRCLGSSHVYLDAENATLDVVREPGFGQRGGRIRSNRFVWSTPLQQGDG